MLLARRGSLISLPGGVTKSGARIGLRCPCYHEHLHDDGAEAICPVQGCPHLELWELRRDCSHYGLRALHPVPLLPVMAGFQIEVALCFRASHTVVAEASAIPLTKKSILG